MLCFSLYKVLFYLVCCLGDLVCFLPQTLTYKVTHENNSKTSSVDIFLSVHTISPFTFIKVGVKHTLNDTFVVLSSGVYLEIGL